MGEIDLLPPEGAQLARSQAVPERQQDHGRIAMSVSVSARRLHKPLDLPLGEVLADPIVGIGKPTRANCSLYSGWRSDPRPPCGRASRITLEVQAIFCRRPLQHVAFQAVDGIGTTDGSLCQNCDFLRGESYATEVRLRRLGSHLCPCSLPVCPGPSDGRRYESQLRPIRASQNQ